MDNTIQPSAIQHNRPLSNSDGNDTKGAGRRHGAAEVDSVQLTGSAKALNAAKQPHTSGAVNTNKVDRVRDALANGGYQPSAERIADKLLAFEQQQMTSKV